MLDTPNARSDPSASKKGTKIMNKNIRLLLSAGSVAILAISALQGCGSDDPATGGGAGAPGAGAPGAGAAGAHTAAGAGGASAGAPAGGAPAGGAPAGGAPAGGAPAGGAGGTATAGAGGASGGAGGAAAGAGGAPSADCTKWCSGANGLIAVCAGMLAEAVNTEPKCLAECNNAAATGAMGLSCWLTHLDNIVTKGMSKATHCPHTSGAPNNGQCNETK